MLSNFEPETLITALLELEFSLKQENINEKTRINTTIFLRFGKEIDISLSYFCNTNIIYFLS